MLKQIVTGGLMIALTLSIAGCSSKLLTEGQAHDPASSDAIAADSTESTPTWTPQPTDDGHTKQVGTYSASATSSS